MELYEICSNPIGLDNRMSPKKKQWPCMSLIWKAIAHIKAIEIPYIDHSLSHIFSILGPHISHITSFGKGWSKFPIYEFSTNTSHQWIGQNQKPHQERPSQCEDAKKNHMHPAKIGKSYFLSSEEAFVCRLVQQACNCPLLLRRTTLMRTDLCWKRSSMH